MFLKKLRFVFNKPVFSINFISNKIFSIFKKKRFNLRDIYKGHLKTEYRGVPCLKSPFDYVMYQMLLHNLKPDLIIEIGTNFGGSTLYLADILDILDNGKIHSIDICDKSYDIVKNHPRIELFYNGWEKYDHNLAKGYKKILVIEDSSHHYLNTLYVMNAFAPLVTEGSYLIVEDGIIDALGFSKAYKGGPVKAIRKFMIQHQEFVLDNDFINFFGDNATFNTNGYLKKINIDTVIKNNRLFF